MILETVHEGMDNRPVTYDLRDSTWGYG